MKRFIPVLIIIIFLSSCKKGESDFIWEKSYGKGEAFFMKASSDSGFSACGEVGGKPYFIRLDKKKSRVIDFGSENPGLFSAAWFDTSGYMTGGSSEGKMLLMRHSIAGNLLWEKTLDAGFKVDYTQLIYTGNGNLLAIGTADPDSSGSGVPGLLFVRYDTTGIIISEDKIPADPFVSIIEPVSAIEALSARKTIIDNAGNIFCVITKKSSSSKTKAAVVKFNDQFQKLWYTELFNNSDFAAASLSILPDASGNIYISGKTELPFEGGTLDNSFLVSLTSAGSVRWKKYFENSNSGSALVFDDTGILLMLNKNCYIINMVDPLDGTDVGRIRIFSLCNSYDTDAFGEDLDINYEKNILVAGKRGGNFYLALKALQ
jgi:hypothetical protein